MIEVVREFIIKQERQDPFELVFGPGGTWSKLVARYPGFRGTTLLRDTGSSRRYLEIDIWDTELQWEQLKAERGAEFSEFNAALDAWVESQVEVGVFRIRAQATVRSLTRRT